MWKVRDDEPAYAFLKESTAPEVNYYEAPIDLIARTGGALPVVINSTRFILLRTIALVVMRVKPHAAKRTTTLRTSVFVLWVMLKAVHTQILSV
jgi:hypothetical protein